MLPTLNVMGSRSKILAVSLAGVAAAAGLLLFAWSTREVITVSVLHEIPLYEPGTLAGAWGTQATVVGTVKAGETVFISGCNDRKSDIDLETTHLGKKAVLGWAKNAYVMQRRRASFDESNATSSCYGLL